MDKIKTFVVQDGKLIIDETTTTILDDYIELIPENTTVRSLKFYVYCQGFERTNPVPFVKINGDVCPIMIQQDYEIKSTDKFQIESVQINKEFFLGNIIMIISDNYKINV